MPTTTTLADLFKPALRMAGITQRPGITPSNDQYNELIPNLNSMLQSWNTDGAKIFTTRIEEFPLVENQMVYTIGPGGDFNTTRPMFIKDANVYLPDSSNPNRYPLKLMDEHEWSLVPMPQIPGGLPWALYYDSAYTAGLGRIYITMQPPEGYTLELFTWRLLSAEYSAISDVVVLPDGYDMAIKTNLALLAVSLYPLDSIIARNPGAMQALRDQARRALETVKTLNTKCPALFSEAEYIGQPGGWWWPGMFSGIGGSGVGGNWQIISVSGNKTGTTGFDGNAEFTLGVRPAGTTQFALFKNGVLQTPTTSYTLNGTTVTFTAGNIPLVGETVSAMGGI